MTSSDPSEQAATTAMSSPHILIVEARFYSDIADELGRGARRALEAAGATYETVTVPGAFEIPAAVIPAGQRCHRQQADDEREEKLSGHL